MNEIENEIERLYREVLYRFSDEAAERRRKDRELALVLEAAVAIFALLTFAAVAWCLA